MTSESFEKHNSHKELSTPPELHLQEEDFAEYVDATQETTTDKVSTEKIINNKEKNKKSPELPAHLSHLKELIDKGLEE